MAGFRLLTRSASLEDPGQDTPVLRGPRLDQRFSTLLEGLRTHDVNTVRLQLGRGLSPNHLEPAKGNRTPLIYAVKHDFTEGVVELLRAGANVNQADASGTTPLHMAAREGHVRTLKILLSYRAEVDPRDINGRTPLHHAARVAHPGVSSRGFVDIVEVLLSAGASLTRTDAEGRLPLHSAATAGNSDLIKILCRGRGNAGINHKDEEGRTPLHYAVLGARSLDAVVTLLGLGAAINAQDLHGDTALHMTAGRLYNHVDDEFDGQCLETLLSHGASVAAKNKEGMNALSLALRRTMWWGRPVSRDHILHAVQQLVAKGACIQDGFAMWRMVESFPSVVPLALNRSFRANTSVRDSEHLRLDLDFGPLVTNKQQLCELQGPRPAPLYHADISMPPPLLRDSEVAMLHYIMWAGRKSLLKHPLCHSFLHMKWYKVRKYFMANVIFYFCFVLSLTTFLLYSHNCPQSISKPDLNTTIFNPAEQSINTAHIEFVNETRLNLNATYSPSANETEPKPGIALASTANATHSYNIFKCGWEGGEVRINLTWWCLVIFSILLDIREVIQILQNPLIYIRNLGNILDAMLVICVPQILISPGSRECCFVEWQQNVAAISIILAWVRFMLFAGQFPSCGVYIVMFSTVAKNVMRFLLMYVPILVAFALGFFVLLRNTVTFQNLGTSLVTVLVMMTGELDYESTFLDPERNSLEPDAHVLAICILVVFVVLVFIILSNLLVGLAVSDMYAIQQRSELLRLTRHVQLMVQVERLFRSKLIPRSIQACLLRSISLTPTPQQNFVVSVYPNQKHGFSQKIFLLILKVFRAKKLLTKLFEICVPEFEAPEHDQSLPSQLMGEAVNMALLEYELDKREEKLHLRAVQLANSRRGGELFSSLRLCGGSGQPSRNTQGGRPSILRPSYAERASWRWTLASDTDNEDEGADIFHPGLQSAAQSQAVWGGGWNFAQKSSKGDPNVQLDEMRKLVLNLASTVDAMYLAQLTHNRNYTFGEINV